MSDGVHGRRDHSVERVLGVLLLDILFGVIALGIGLHSVKAWKRSGPLGRMWHSLVVLASVVTVTVNAYGWVSGIGTDWADVSMRLRNGLLLLMCLGSFVQYVREFKDSDPDTRSTIMKRLTALGVVSMVCTYLMLSA